MLQLTDLLELRRQALAGAYTVVDRSTEPNCVPGHNAVEIWATGVMVPEAIKASRELAADGVFASVVNCISPDLVYRRWQSGVHAGDWAAPFGRPRIPVVTVLDGHPSALAWVGSRLGPLASRVLENRGRYLTSTLRLRSTPRRSRTPALPPWVRPEAESDLVLSRNVGYLASQQFEHDPPKSMIPVAHHRLTDVLDVRLGSQNRALEVHDPDLISPLSTSTAKPMPSEP
ncbi:MAG: hypothetical protein ACYDHE_02420 [Candidatus Acidiferrales bacterium]